MYRRPAPYEKFNVKELRSKLRSRGISVPNEMRITTLRTLYRMNCVERPLSIFKLGKIELHPELRIITLDGVMGSGKTYLFRHLQNVLPLAYPNLSFQFFDEKVDKYMNFEGHNPLKVMYKDPARESAIVQMYILDVMYRELYTFFKSFEKADVVVMDRNLYSCMIFAIAHYTRNNMSQFDLMFICKRLINLSTLLGLPPLGTHHLAHLYGSPEFLQARIQKRDRKNSGERTGCTLSFLITLAKSFDKFNIRFIKKFGFESYLALPSRTMSVQQMTEQIRRKFIDPRAKISSDSHRDIARHQNGAHQER